MTWVTRHGDNTRASPFGTTAVLWVILTQAAVFGPHNTSRLGYLGWVFPAASRALSVGDVDHGPARNISTPFRRLRGLEGLSSAGASIDR